MKPVVKFGLVLGGYVLAFAFAFAVSASYSVLTSGPGNQASSGMAAFGDLILFLAVFGVAALLPTSAALYFLRPVELFWTALTLIAYVVGMTGLVALVAYIVAQVLNSTTWSGVAVLRFFLAPLFSGGFFLSGIFAPSRSSRIALFAVAILEAAVIASVAILLILHVRLH